MKETDPQLYRNWSLYMRLRQAMLSAVTFNSVGWNDWDIGHAKLIGIILWHLENSDQVRFKYSRVFKKQGYRRTHNYRLLKGIIDAGILTAEGRGHYSVPKESIKIAYKAIEGIERLDKINCEAGINE